MATSFRTPEMKGGAADLRSAGAALVDAAALQWQTALPVLSGRGGINLRELRVEDAPALFEQLTSDAASRYISAPPTSVEGFERFIRWTHTQRESGLGLVFGIVRPGERFPVGIVQVQSIGGQWTRAEWGFALAADACGTGMFRAAADQVLAFAFRDIGVERLEARVAAANARGLRAVEKLGGVRECILRRSFWRHGVWQDQVLCTILASDWASATKVRAFQSLH